MPQNETHSPKSPIVTEFIIGKVSNTGRNAQFIENAKTYSRTKQDNCCWGAKITGSDTKKINIIEVFTAPVRSIFTTDNDSQISGANHGQYWKINRAVAISPDNYLEHC